MGTARNEIPYQTEYLAIHNQRIALVRLMHLWHQIGFPAALLIFGFLFSFGSMNGDVIQIVMATVFAIATVWFVRLYSIFSLDAAVVQLYPRIVALELMLGYQFYRSYLRKRGEAEKRFVENCEKITEKSPEELWKKVELTFRPKDFPSWRRGHEILNWAAIIMTAGFILVAILCSL